MRVFIINSVKAFTSLVDMHQNTCEDCEVNSSASPFSNCIRVEVILQVFFLYTCSFFCFILVETFSNILQGDTSIFHCNLADLPFFVYWDNFLFPVSGLLSCV